MEPILAEPAPVRPLASVQSLVLPQGLGAHVRLGAEVAAVGDAAGVLVGVVPEAPAAGEGLGAVGAGEPWLVLLLRWLHIGGWGIGIG